MSVDSWKREFAETIAKHRRQGWGWRYDGLDGWTTEAIFAQLRELGIDTDAGRFREQAAAACGIDALRKDWDGQIREEMDIAFWPDFPLIAVPLLWERLTPDLVCPELVEQRLYRAIRAEKEGAALPEVAGVSAAVAAAVGLAKYLGGIPAGERAKQFDEINHRGMYDYSDWLLNLVGDQGRKYPDAVMQVADVMTDCVNGRSFQSEAAMVLAAAGRRSEAIERARAIVERFSDDLWARILAGDVYKEVGNVAEAKRLYAEALAMAREANDRDAAAERLQSIDREAETQAEQWDDVLRQRIAEETPALPAMAASRPARKSRPQRPVPVRQRQKVQKVLHAVVL